MARVRHPTRVAWTTTRSRPAQRVVKLRLTSANSPQPVETPSGSHSEVASGFLRIGATMERAWATGPNARAGPPRLALTNSPLRLVAYTEGSVACTARTTGKVLDASPTPVRHRVPRAPQPISIAANFTQPAQTGALTSAWAACSNASIVARSARHVARPLSRATNCFPDATSRDSDLFKSRTG